MSVIQCMKGWNMMKKTRVHMIFITKVFVIAIVFLIIFYVICMNIKTTYAVNGIFSISSNGSTWIEEIKNNDNPYATLYIALFNSSTPISCRLFLHDQTPLTDQSILTNSNTSYNMEYTQYVPIGSNVEAHFNSGYYYVSISGIFVP